MEIDRGLDLFQLTPTKFLTQNEIDAARTVHLAELNVQDQPKIEWPENLVVAKAYVDQLARSQALSSKEIKRLRKAIHNAEKSHMNKKKVAKLKRLAPGLEKDATGAKTPADSQRMHALAGVLEHLA